MAVPFPACNDAGFDFFAPEPFVRDYINSRHQNTRGVRSSPLMAAAAAAAALVLAMLACLGPSQWLSPRACPELLCTSSCEWATRNWSERSSGLRGTPHRSRSVPAHKLALVLSLISDNIMMRMLLYLVHTCFLKGLGGHVLRGSKLFLPSLRLQRQSYTMR